MKIAALVLAWWFVAVYPGAHRSFTVIGPFRDKAQCEWARGMERVRNHVVIDCWGDGRP